jgi:hypothetical protein
MVAILEFRLIEEEVYLIPNPLKAHFENNFIRIF